MRARHALPAVLTVVVALVLAACGSTVSGARLHQLAAGGSGLQRSNQTSAGGNSGVGSAAGGPSASGGTAGSNGPASSGAAAGTTFAGGIGSTGGASVGAAPVGGVTAPSAGPIEVGFIAGKCSNCSSLSTAYTAPTYSDQQLEQAMVNGIDAHGGIAGRKISPVFATVDTASSSWTTDYQAACSTFTQDHHVVAVLGYSFAYEDNLATCLAKAGVLWLNGGYGVGDLQDFTTQPLYFSDIAPSEDSELVVSVSSALEDGWISTSSKLGVLQAGCPSDLRAFNNSLKPYIAAHHLDLVDTQTANCVTGAQDDGNAAALIQHAELQMRTEGIDSVIITGIPLILFGEDAESQHWHPHYLTFAGGGVYEPYLPADQLANIHGAGWLPTLDLDATHLPPLTAAQQHCKQLLHDGGIDVPPSAYNSAFIACDGVLMYAQGVTRAGSSAPTQVARGLEASGTSYPSAMTVDGATDLAAGHHAAPHNFRTNVYQSACSCFAYVGPVRPLPLP